MHMHEPFNFDQIDDQIFIGNNQCCQLHFNEALLTQGISADISLEEKLVDAPFGVSSYLWLPTPDGHAPTIDQLMLGSAHLKNLIAQDRKIYIHCKNGHGRAPTLVAAYYISTGKTADEAIRHLLAKRHGAHFTHMQEKALYAYETLLRNDFAAKSLG